MSVAGDDRFGAVCASECDEVVIVRIIGRAWSRCRVLNTNATFGDQCDERLAAAISCGSLELRPTEDSRQLGEQQGRDQRINVAVEQRLDNNARRSPVAAR